MELEAFTATMFKSLFEKSLKYGDMITREGTEGDFFYLLYKGKCELKKKPLEEKPDIYTRPDEKKRIAICQVDVGSFIGEEILFCKEYEYDVKVVSSGAVLFEFDKKRFREDFEPDLIQSLKKLYLEKREKNLEIFSSALKFMQIKSRENSFEIDREETATPKKMKHAHSQYSSLNNSMIKEFPQSEPKTTQNLLKSPPLIEIQSKVLPRLSTESIFSSSKSVPFGRSSITPINSPERVSVESSSWAKQLFTPGRPHEGIFDAESDAQPPSNSFRQLINLPKPNFAMQLEVNSLRKKMKSFLRCVLEGNKETEAQTEKSPQSLNSPKTNLKDTVIAPPKVIYKTVRSNSGYEGVGTKLNEIKEYLDGLVDENDNAERDISNINEFKFGFDPEKTKPKSKLITAINLNKIRRVEINHAKLLKLKEISLKHRLGLLQSPTSSKFANLKPEKPEIKNEEPTERTLLKQEFFTKEGSNLKEYLAKYKKAVENSKTHRKTSSVYMIDNTAIKKVWHRKSQSIPDIKEIYSPKKPEIFLSPRLTKINNPNVSPHQSHLFLTKIEHFSSKYSKRVSLEFCNRS
jgi:cAMP-binding proteins - catabolite gene activator and regulatory subunit of cAMP-dependent protein kinases